MNLALRACSLEPRSVRICFVGAVLSALVAGCTGAGNAVSEPRRSGTAARKVAKPWPLTRRELAAETIHSVRVEDPYRWLEAEAPEVATWVREQDAYARRVLTAAPGREALRKRLEELEYVEEVSAPERHGSRYFFSQRHRDKEKRVYHFREGEDGESRVLLDPEALAPDGSVSIRGVKPSHDGRLAAFRMSHANRDESVISVVEVETGRISEIDTIPGVQYVDATWVKGEDVFYYARLPTDDSIPAAERAGHARVFRHEVGRPYVDDELVFDATGDPRTLLGPDVSMDGELLFVYVVHGSVRTDVYFKSLKRKDAAFRPLFVGRPGLFFAAAWNGKIYARTNHDAERWRLIRIDDPSQPERWTELVPEAPDAVLDAFSLVGGHLSLQYQKRASSLIAIVDLEGRPVRTLSMPGIGLAEGLMGRPEDDIAYYSFSSFLTPPTVHWTSVARGEAQVHARVELAADPSRFPLRQVFYPSKDGTRVPMFIIEPSGFEPRRGTPFVLTGYGGFGKSVLPRFNASLYPWLEAGGGVAVANLRGGGEYGEAWHQAGMREKKQAVFDDFIAAAEHLIGEGYTRPDRLAITGGSNGGLLVGAAMTQRPELFGAVICRAPLLDMLRFHLFGGAGRWTAEYGDIGDPAQFRALHAYSPYHQVRAGVTYPPLLLMTADQDDRVAPLHARKFAAALQAVGEGDRPVLLRIEQQAGHAGADRVRQRIEAEVDEQSFLLSALGVR